MRVYAAQVLQNWFPELEAETLPVLVAGLRSEHEKVREEVLSTLARTPHLSNETLAAFLKDPSADVRSTVLVALSVRCAAPRSALPDLLRILREHSLPGWGCAVGLPCELGPTASEAIPDLARIV